MGNHQQHTLIRDTVSEVGWTGVNAGEGRRGASVGCPRSLCNVDVLSCTGSVMFPGCWEGNRGRDVKSRRSKQRVSNHTARHSKEAARSAKRLVGWQVAWFCKLTHLCSYRSCRRSSQTQTMSRGIYLCLSGPTRYVQCHSMCPG